MEKSFNFYDGAVIYISDHEVKYTKEDFIKITGGNITYAKDLFDRVEWQHPSTLIDEDLREGECVYFKGRYYRTGGQHENVIITDAALFAAEAINEWLYGNKTYIPKIGGYYPLGGRKNVWEAFDNRGGEFTVELFDDESEALKYAKGEMALTINGTNI